MKEKKTIINVQNLTVNYGDKTIIDDISFKVYDGEIFVILGASGSGKTTLLNNLIGLQQPKYGKILIDNDDIVTAFGGKRLNILRKFGVMYQNGALFGSMSLLENILLPLEEFSDLSQEAIKSVAHDKLKMVDLGNFADYMPSEISGGMRKRAAIARAMALDPRILFLDEPSAGLDPITSAHLDKLILSLSQTLGVTFILVSHELPSIYAIADRVIMLRNNKIVANGNPKTLQTECDNIYVRKFFNREV